MRKVRVKMAPLRAATTILAAALMSHLSSIVHAQVCTAKTAQQWAASGVTVATPGSGRVGVSALGAVSTAPGWNGVPSITCSGGGVASTLAGNAGACTPSGHHCVVNPCGYADGPAAASVLCGPQGVAVTPDGQTVLVAEPAGRIRRVELATNMVSTLSNHTGVVDLEVTPDGLAALLVGGGSLWRMELATGAVSTVAGSGVQGYADGTGASARFRGASGVAVTPDGRVALVADRDNHRIRRVELATGTVSTFAGNGVQGYADGSGVQGYEDYRRWWLVQFNHPTALAVTPDGLEVLVAELTGQRIRRVVLATGVVSTLAGSGHSGSADGNGTSAQLNHPSDVAVTPDGLTALVTDSAGNNIRQIVLATGVVSTVNLTWAIGNNGNIGIRSPYGVAVTPDGTAAFVADNDKRRVRRVSLAAFAVSGVTEKQCAGKTAVQWAALGVAVPRPSAGWTTVTSLGAVSAAPGWSGVPVVTCMGATDVLSLAGNASAGYANGAGGSARFNRPFGVAAAPDGLTALVAEYGGRRIRRIVIATGVVSLVAGSGYAGYANGVGASAQFMSPRDVSVTPDGLTAVVADEHSNRIRCITLASSMVSTLAGSGAVGNGDGAGASAQFHFPCGVAVTPDGLTVLVADSNNHRIRSIVLATQVVTTVAGSGTAGYTEGVGASAHFNQPMGLAVTPDGLTAVVADTGNRRIRRIVLTTGVVSLLAGSGTPGYTEGVGATAQFNDPKGVSVTPDGLAAVVVDPGNQRLRHTVLATGAVSTVATRGQLDSWLPPLPASCSAAGSCTFANGASLICNGNAQAAGMSDTLVCRACNNATSQVGACGGGGACPYQQPGNWRYKYHAYANGTVQRCSPPPDGEPGYPGNGSLYGTLTPPYIHGGSTPNSQFQSPYGVAVMPDGLTALVADPGYHGLGTTDNRIRRIFFSAGFAVSGVQTKHACPTRTAAQWAAVGVTVTTPGAGYVRSTSLGVVRAAPGWDGAPVVLCQAAGTVSTLAGADPAAPYGLFMDAVGTGARFSSPADVTVAPDGMTALVADADNHRIRRIVLVTGAVSTLAGDDDDGRLMYADGLGTAARFRTPRGVALTPDGLTALVADTGNHRIRRLVLATTAVTTLAGNGTVGSADGSGALAQFNRPYGVVVTPDGFTVLVADQLNHRIRRIELATAMVSTLAGNNLGFAEGVGTGALFNQPLRLAVTPDSLTVLVTDHHNRRIRRIVLATGNVSTLAGSGRAGYADGSGGSVQFGEPLGIAVTPDGLTALATGKTQTTCGEARYWGIAAANASASGHYKPLFLDLFESHDFSGSNFVSPTEKAIYTEGFCRAAGQVLVHETWPRESCRYGSGPSRQYCGHYQMMTCQNAGWGSSWITHKMPLIYRDLGTPRMIRSATHGAAGTNGMPKRTYIVSSNDAVTWTARFVTTAFTGRHVQSPSHDVGGSNTAVSIDTPVPCVHSPGLRKIVLATGAVSLVADGHAAGLQVATTASDASPELSFPDSVAVTPDGLTALTSDSFTHLIRTVPIVSTFKVSGMVERTCKAKTLAEWAFIGVVVTTPGTGLVSVSSLGVVRAATTWVGSPVVTCERGVFNVTGVMLRRPTHNALVCRARTRTAWAQLGVVVAEPSSGLVSAASLGAVRAAAGWGGSPVVTCTSNGTAFGVSNVFESVCASKTAPEWASVGVLVSTPSPGAVTASSLGTIRLATGWTGSPMVACVSSDVVSDVVATLADSSSTEARFDMPTAVAVMPDGLSAFIADASLHRINHIVIPSSTSTSVGQVVSNSSNWTLAGSSMAGHSDGAGTNAQFNAPYGVAVTPDGLAVLVADTGNHRIRRIEVATGVVSTLVGNSTGYAEGTGSSVQFNAPTGLVVTPDGFTALVADTGNHRIRRIVLATARVSTLAGSGAAGYAEGTATTAQFNRPHGVAVTPDGQVAFVGDTNNHRIRRIFLANATVSTLAGLGYAGHADGAGAIAKFHRPHGLALTPDGEMALVADVSNHRIRRILLATGDVSTLAGCGTAGYINGWGRSVRLNNPFAVAVTPSGVAALVADTVNRRIRSVSLRQFVVSGVRCAPGYDSDTVAGCTPCALGRAGVGSRVPCETCPVGALPVNSSGEMSTSGALGCAACPAGKAFPGAFEDCSDGSGWRSVTRAEIAAANCTRVRGDGGHAQMIALRDNYTRLDFVNFPTAVLSPPAGQHAFGLECPECVTKGGRAYCVVLRQDLVSKLTSDLGCETELDASRRRIGGRSHWAVYNRDGTYAGCWQALGASHVSLAYPSGHRHHKPERTWSECAELASQWAYKSTGWSHTVLRCDIVVPAITAVRGTYVIYPRSPLSQAATSPDLHSRPTSWGDPPAVSQGGIVFGLASQQPGTLALAAAGGTGAGKSVFTLLGEGLCRTGLLQDTSTATAARPDASLRSCQEYCAASAECGFIAFKAWQACLRFVHPHAALARSGRALAPVVAGAAGRWDFGVSLTDEGGKVGDLSIVREALLTADGLHLAGSGELIGVAGSFPGGGMASVGHPQSVNISLGAKKTLAAWVTLDSTSHGAVITVANLTGTGNDTRHSFDGIAISSGRWFASSCNGCLQHAHYSPHYPTGPGAVIEQTGQRVFVAVVYNGSNASVYRNGVRYGNTFQTTSAEFLAGTWKLSVGNHAEEDTNQNTWMLSYGSNHALTTSASGTVHSAMLWGRALSPEEITAAYAAGPSVGSTTKAGGQAYSTQSEFCGGLVQRNGARFIRISSASRAGPPCAPTTACSSVGNTTCKAKCPPDSPSWGLHEIRCFTSSAELPLEVDGAYPDNPATPSSNLIDGDSSTVWYGDPNFCRGACIEAGGQRVTLRLASARPMQDFLCTVHQAGDSSVSAISVEHSLDKVSWAVAQNVTVGIGQTTICGVGARQIRFRAMGAGMCTGARNSEQMATTVDARLPHCSWQRAAQESQCRTVCAALDACTGYIYDRFSTNNMRCRLSHKFTAALQKAQVNAILHTHGFSQLSQSSAFACSVPPTNVFADLVMGSEAGYTRPPAFTTAPPTTVPANAQCHRKESACALAPATQHIRLNTSASTGVAATAGNTSPTWSINDLSCTDSYGDPVVMAVDSLDQPGPRWQTWAIVSFSAPRVVALDRSLVPPHDRTQQQLNSVMCTLRQTTALGTVANVSVEQSINTRYWSQSAHAVIANPPVYSFEIEVLPAAPIATQSYKRSTKPDISSPHVITIPETRTTAHAAQTTLRFEASQSSASKDFSIRNLDLEIQTARQAPFLHGYTYSHNGNWVQDQSGVQRHVVRRPSLARVTCVPLIIR